MTSARPTPKLQDKPIVFVVDDDISVRESLEMLIQFAGWQPETFASAEEFLAHPRTLVPSCLVLDISLPGLNGLDLQKQVAVSVRSSGLAPFDHLIWPTPDIHSLPHSAGICSCRPGVSGAWRRP